MSFALLPCHPLQNSGTLAGPRKMMCEKKSNAKIRPSPATLSVTLTNHHFPWNTDQSSHHSLRLKGQFPPEPSRKRHGSESTVFRTAIPTRRGTDTFQLMAQDVHNYNSSETRLRTGNLKIEVPVWGRFRSVPCRNRIQWNSIHWL